MNLDGNSMSKLRILSSKIRKNLIVSKGMKLEVIPLSDVMIFFFEGRNVFIVTAMNEVLLCDIDLSKIEREICSFFFRINRQVIINAKAIDFFTYEMNYTISITLRPQILNPQINLSVSKNKVFEFKRWISYECCICSCSPEMSAIVR